MKLTSQQSKPITTLAKEQGFKYEPTIPFDGKGVDFITIVAHQMRTPLTAIKWYVDLLLAGKAGDLQHEQRDYLLDVYQSNERMIRLVDNLLVIEQLEQDALPIVKRKISMSKVIQSIVGEYQTFAKVNNIALIFHAGQEEHPDVYVDPIYVRLAIKNIIDNALRYTPKRGTVVINCEQVVEENGDFLKIKITDTGIGIPYEERDRIFTKFYRSSESMAMQTEGTGLGLYIAKIITEKNGGSVAFMSRQSVADRSVLLEEHDPEFAEDEIHGQGTIFLIKLPVAN